MILSFPLYQPAAPKFFEVTDTTGTRLFVQFRGQGWVEYRTDLPAGSVRDDGKPRRHLSSGVLTHSERPAQVHKNPSAGSSVPPAQTPLPSPRHDTQGDPATRVRKLSRIETAGGGNSFSRKERQALVRRAAALADTPGVVQKIVRKLGDYATGPGISPASRLITQERISREGFAYTSTTIQAAPLSAGVVKLHAALDEARDAHDRARASAQAERMTETMEVYSRAIAAVDAADPLFYLGRVKSLAPLQRGERVELRRSVDDCFATSAREERPS